MKLRSDYMKKLFVSLMVLLAMTTHGHATTRKECSEECHASAACPKKFKLPQVNVSKTPVQPKGSLVFNCKDKKVYVSDGHNWIALEEEQPAPELIVVDPTICPNGVTKFNTIQEAIDSLGDQQIFNTTIQIAKGSYPENVVLQSILNSDPTSLKFVGDLRQIAGVGIAHDSFWNDTAGPTGPVGGGAGSKAVLNTGVNSITVTASVGTNPDFVAAGVVSGDKVIIRDNLGTFTTYTVALVAPTTLTFTTNIITPANALGAAMSIAPNVVINPATGNVIKQNAFASFTGLFLQVPSGQGGLSLGDFSDTIITNLLIFGATGGTGINTPDPADPNQLLGMQGVNSSLSCSTNLGFTIFTTGTAMVLGRGNNIRPCGGLIAVAPGGLALFSSNAKVLVNANVSGFRSIGRILSDNVSDFIAGSPVDIIVSSGNAFQASRRTNVRVAGGSITIRGAPSTGMVVATGAGVSVSTGNFISLNSTAASFIGAQIGSGAGDTVAVDLIFRDLTIPAGSSSYIAQVSDGSILIVRGITGTQTIGANSNGFLVKNASQLIWRTGNVTGNAATTLASGAKLFDIQDASVLVIPPDTTRTFTNYPIIYNFDNSSRGDLSNVTSTTIAGGTNVIASNMSRVELDTVQFNLSGANIGITASFGGFVGKKGGTVITNSASIPISSCNFPTNVPQNTYTCTYNDGLVVVSP